MHSLSLCARQKFSRKFVTVLSESEPSHCVCTHTHPFNGPLSGTTQVSRYQKGKTYLDFTEARDSEWQWHPLGYMQVCTFLQSDNHASTPPLNFLHAGCTSCRPTNSVKALKALDMQSSIILCQSQAGINWKGCDRRGIWRKNGG